MSAVLLGASSAIGCNLVLDPDEYASGTADGGALTMPLEPPDDASFASPDGDSLPDWVDVDDDAQAPLGGDAGPGPCPDADGDEVCDQDDVCAGGDDAGDADDDGRPDACDCDTADICHPDADCGEGVNTLACTCHDGFGGDGRDECIAVDCGDPQAPEEGSVSVPDTLYSAVATYACDEGHELSGTDTRTCQRDGTWSDAVPTCTVVDCGGRTAPDNGSVTTPGGTTFGQVADYACDEGYGIVGATRQTCQADGTWDGAPPTCALGDCSNLTSPDNGLVTTPTGTTVGADAIYSCNVGYELVGDAMRTCRTDGTWSGTAPSCAIHDCGALSNPPSGTVATPDGTTYGATATYTCNVGHYRAGGSAQRTCEPTGWSGSAAQCQIYNCGTVAAPQNGSRTLSSTTYGSTVSYACDTGYQLTGQMTRTCQDNGTWSGSAPTCPPRNECSDGSHGCDGFPCVNGSGYGYQCNCGAGYESSGGSFPTCNPVALLRSDQTTLAFGNRENGTTGSITQWVIRNDGAAPTAALNLTNTNSADFSVTNGCSSPIPAGGSCNVGVRFSPDSYGLRNGTLTIGNGSDGSLTLSVSGNSQARLTVARGGAGSGTVTSNTGGISCGTACTALYDVGAVVRLRGDTQNGANSVLSAWSASSCPDPSRECVVNVSSTMTVTATFSTQVNNLIFATSRSLAANLGGARAYDTVCNEVATAAGINNSTGNGYIAAMSDGNSNFLDRIGGGVRGWVRLDGRPFGNTMSQIMGRTVYHPVLYNELGERVDQPTWSGTRADGSILSTCNDWTTTSSSVYGRLGHTLKGPNSWIEQLARTCNNPAPVLCLGNTKTAPLSVPTTSGKRIWLSAPYRAGAVTPDQRCYADRPAGLSNGVALVGYTNRTAASRLDAAANYVRVDGQLVGTGAQLIALDIITGIWQLGDGTYIDGDIEQTWSGAASMTEFGTAATTCNNWTDGSSAYSGYIGEYDTTSLRFWWTFGSVACDAFGDPDRPLHLYCVEP